MSQIKAIWDKVNNKFHIFELTAPLDVNISQRNIARQVNMHTLPQTSQQWQLSKTGPNSAMNTEQMNRLGTGQKGNLNHNTRKKMSALKKLHWLQDLKKMLPLYCVFSCFHCLYFYFVKMFFHNACKGKVFFSSMEEFVLY